MKATVDESCVASEKCCEICPEVFQMGDDYAEVIVDKIPPEYEDAVREAAEECPVEAIILEE